MLEEELNSGQNFDELEFKALIDMAVLGWNLSFFPPSERIDFVKTALAASLPEAPPQLNQFLFHKIEEMMERKMRLYPEDHRHIVSHEFKYYGLHRPPNLQVMYTSPED